MHHLAAWLVPNVSAARLLYSLLRLHVGRSMIVYLTADRPAGVVCRCAYACISLATILQNASFTLHVANPQTVSLDVDNAGTQAMFRSVCHSSAACSSSLECLRD